MCLLGVRLSRWKKNTLISFSTKSILHLIVDLRALTVVSNNNTKVLQVKTNEQEYTFAPFRKNNAVIYFIYSLFAHL